MKPEEKTDHTRWEAEPSRQYFPEENLAGNMTESSFLDIHQGSWAHDTKKKSSLFSEYLKESFYVNLCSVDIVPRRSTELRDSISNVLVVTYETYFFEIWLARQLTWPTGSPVVFKVASIPEYPSWKIYIQVKLLYFNSRKSSHSLLFFNELPW